MNGKAIPTIVVVTLAILAVAGLGLMGFLATTQTPIPDQIDRLTVGAVSALAAILATTRGATETQQVVVKNPPTDPVPTEDVA